MQVFKLYNTKTENRISVEIEEGSHSKKAAIDVAIKQHEKVLRGHNKPSNWKVEKVLKSGQATLLKPKSKQPKAKSKMLMRSN